MCIDTGKTNHRMQSLIITDKTQNIAEHLGIKNSSTRTSCHLWIPECTTLHGDETGRVRVHPTPYS